MLITYPFGMSRRPSLAPRISQSFSHQAFRHRRNGPIAAVIELVEPRVLLAAAISVGDHNLLPNTPNQLIDIRTMGDSVVTGLNIRAQLGDGTGPQSEPVFDGVDFAGGIWDAFPTTISGGPVGGAEQFLQASVVFNASGNSTMTDGLIVRLSIDTTGFTSGTFPINLKMTEIGTDTVFIVAGGFDEFPTITNGMITIGANDAPLAVDDTAITNEGTPVTLTQADLKGNDTDVDNTNAQLSVTTVANPTNGTVVLNGDGTITFSPTPDFFGTAGFDDTLSDGSLTDTGHVTITVNAVNDAPAAVDDTAITNEDTLGVIDVLANDTDPDNDILSVAGLDTNGTLGTVTILNSMVQYDPAGRFESLGAGATATDTFRYMASDSSGLVQVTMPLDGSQEVPQVSTTGTGSATVMLDAVTGEITIEGSFSGLQGNVAAVHLHGPAAPREEAGIIFGLNVSGDTSGSFSGSATLSAANLDHVLQELTYINVHSSAEPLGEIRGQVAGAIVSVTINGVNDLPTITDIANQTTKEATPTAAISFTVGDVETSAGLLTVTGSSSNVSLVPDGNIAFAGSGANRAVTITPAPNQNGTATITVTVTDAVGGTASDTFTLTVIRAVTVENVTAVEGGGLLFTVTLNSAVPAGTLVNVTLADVTATRGTAPLVTPEDYDNVVAALSFTGTAGETQQFTVATLDDAVVEASETFTVSLDAVNPLVTDTDTATGTITDNDGAAVTVENVTAVEGGGLVFTVTLNAAVPGGTLVNVTLSDVTATGGAAPLVTPEDYDNVVAALSFAGTAGETKQFTVATLNDTVVEAAETFTVSLNAVNPLLTDTDTATGTITDNDSGTATVADLVTAYVSAVNSAASQYTAHLQEAVNSLNAQIALITEGIQDSVSELNLK